MHRSHQFRRTKATQLTTESINANKAPARAQLRTLTRRVDEIQATMSQGKNDRFRGVSKLAGHTTVLISPWSMAMLLRVNTPQTWQAASNWSMMICLRYPVITSATAAPASETQQTLRAASADTNTPRTQCRPPAVETARSATSPVPAPSRADPADDVPANRLHFGGPSSPRVVQRRAHIRRGVQESKLDITYTSCPCREGIRNDPR